jgi:predicted ATP-dependent protease
LAEPFVLSVGQLICKGKAEQCLKEKITVQIVATIAADDAGVSCFAICCYYSCCC